MKSALIVEDDVDIRMTLKELLESEDFTVHTASNGQEGLNCLEKLEVRPDIILLDLYMPVMSGKAFLKKIKSHFPVLSSIPIIVMTAASTGEYPEDFDHEFIIKKPIDVNQLFTKLDSILEG